MPVMRSILVFLPAAAIALLLTTSFAVQQALAKPIPVSSSSSTLARFANFAARTDRLSAPRHLASYTTAIPTKTQRVPSRITAGHSERKAVWSASHVPRQPDDLAPDNSNAPTDKVALLQRYHHQALEHAAKYQYLASDATSASAANPAFQQHASTELSNFNTNFKGFTTVLAELGADNGLANLDPTNDLEIMLENVVNANKNILEVTYKLVASLPIVGPILGPIVYEIKCTLDDLLDIVENLSDSIINAIQPVLEAILGDTPTATCSSGVHILGLCI